MSGVRGIGQVRQSIHEFRYLNRRRLFGSPPLAVSELERWGELRDLLGAHFGLVGDAEARDQRQHLRIPTHLKVVFESDSELREAVLTNISEGGLFIATERPLDVASPLQLMIDAGACHGTISVRARVVWRRSAASGEAAGMGLRFEDLDDRQRASVDRLIESVAGRTPGASDSDPRC